MNYQQSATGILQTLITERTARLNAFALERTLMGVYVSPKVSKEVVEAIADNVECDRDNRDHLERHVVGNKACLESGIDMCVCGYIEGLMRSEIV